MALRSSEKHREVERRWRFCLSQMTVKRNSRHLCIECTEQEHLIYAGALMCVFSALIFMRPGLADRPNDINGGFYNVKPEPACLLREGPDQYLYEQLLACRASG